MTQIVIKCVFWIFVAMAFVGPMFCIFGGLILLEIEEAAQAKRVARINKQFWDNYCLRQKQVKE